MGREVRRVPADWKHPKKNGSFVPLFEPGAPIEELQAEWDRECARWESREHEDVKSVYLDEGREPCSWEEWHGRRPDTADYMPYWPAEEKTHLMMYEDTTEGTPISPAFETPEELARWLVDNKASSFGSMTATYEQWLRVAQRGWAPSAAIVVAPDGSGVMMSGVAAATELDTDEQ